MKKVWLTILTTSILFFSNLSFGQIGVQAQPENNFWDHVRFGGGLGISFGNGYFSGTISPSAIYDFNRYFSMGPALHLSYQSGDGFNTTLLGASLITLFNPIPEIQLSTEVEQLRVHQNIEQEGMGRDYDHFWNTALFTGVGYRNENVTIGVRYNVLFKDDEDIYTTAWSPFVRFYF
tara:strand:+ start:124 stop:654 length:531 start_codon:yes stop_codon:yes gene_type:complete